jgi:hypothetical protein
MMDTSLPVASEHLSVDGEEEILLPGRERVQMSRRFSQKG